MKTNRVERIQELNSRVDSLYRLADTAEMDEDVRADAKDRILYLKSELYSLNQSQLTLHLG